MSRQQDEFTSQTQILGQQLRSVIASTGEVTQHDQSAGRTLTRGIGSTYTSFADDMSRLGGDVKSLRSKPLHQAVASSAPFMRLGDETAQQTSAMLWASDKGDELVPQHQYDQASQVVGTAITRLVELGQQVGIETAEAAEQYIGASGPGSRRRGEQD